MIPCTALQFHSETDESDERIGPYCMMCSTLWHHSKLGVTWEQNFHSPVKFSKYGESIFYHIKQILYCDLILADKIL